MNHKRAKTWAQYLGIAASIAVPAIVIAQQQRNPPADGTFAAQTLLRAGDVEQLRDALADAITRLNQLEGNGADRIVKGNGDAPGQVYEVVGQSPATPQNGQALAVATCRDADDVMLTCGCQGTIAGDGTANQQQFDLRTVNASNEFGDESSCTCQGLHVGDAQTRVLVARISCITVQ